MIKQPVETPQAKAPPQEEPPPFLGSWRNVYLLLVGELVLLTVLFAALTRWAS
ncbi:MAG TPA: hypothetical protein VKY51_02920 [Fredinandcohnia sp.]|nr:hypothetical protein [Fredinandcohnia sp.]